jgi:hypothetical protein
LIYRNKNISPALFYCLALGCLIFTACGPAASSIVNTPIPSWTYATLKNMDQVDPDVSPNLDLIALYSRVLNDEYQIRLDFLDLDTILNSTTLLALDIRPGGSQRTPFSISSDLNWDLLIVVKPASSSYIINDNLVTIPGSFPKITVDLEMDSVVIEVPVQDLPGSPTRYKLQAIVLCPGQEGTICDKSPISYPVLSYSKQISVAFVFWDLLPASTPLQILRHWDGAHSGPFGQRHGLKHLLENSSKYKIPILLLGLDNPESEAGLKLLGQTAWVNELAKQELVYSTISPLVNIALSLPEVDQSDRNNFGQFLKFRHRYQRSVNLWRRASKKRVGGCVNS